MPPCSLFGRNLQSKPAQHVVPLEGLKGISLVPGLRRFQAAPLSLKAASVIHHATNRQLRELTICPLTKDTIVIRGEQVVVSGNRLNVLLARFGVLES